MSTLSQSGDDVLIRVRVQPRARKDEIAGVRGDALVIRVTAPPVDGRANAAVEKLLAKALGVPPSRVAAERGLTGRDKVIRVARITVAEAQERIDR